MGIRCFIMVVILAAILTGIPLAGVQGQTVNPRNTDPLGAQPGGTDVPVGASDAVTIIQGAETGHVKGAQSTGFVDSDGYWVMGRGVPNHSLTPLATTTVLAEGFEGSFPGSTWSLSGSPTWGAVTCFSDQGVRSGWAGGSALPC